jgi:hypothetical protein
MQNHYFHKKLLHISIISLIMKSLNDYAQQYIIFVIENDNFYGIII